MNHEHRPEEQEQNSQSLGGKHVLITIPVPVFMLSNRDSVYSRFC